MKTIKNICYSDIGHERQVLDVYLPESEEFDVFIYLHGGGMEKGSKDGREDMVSYLVKHNVACVLANYRLYPSAQYPDFVKDGAAALAWAYNNMQNYGKVGKIFAGGSSAGAYISQLLCFDEKYLKPHKLKCTDFAGFIHDSGQPTTHFNVLRERGMDTRKVVIDDAAPLYHIGELNEYPPMQFMVADKDLAGRYEQVQLVLRTMTTFGYDMDKVHYKLMENSTHTQYNHRLDENGDCEVAKVYYEFIKQYK